MWTVGGAQKSGEKEDSFLKMDTRSGSVGLGSSEIINMNLYQNRWVLSIKMRNPSGGDTLRVS